MILLGAAFALAVKIKLPGKQILAGFPIDVKDADLAARWLESPESQELEADVYAVFTGITGLLTRLVNHLTIYGLGGTVTEPRGTLTGEIFSTAPPAVLPFQAGELVIQSEWLLQGSGGYLRLTYEPWATTPR